MPAGPALETSPPAATSKGTQSRGPYYWARQDLAKMLIPFLAERLDAPRDVTIDIWTGEYGKIYKAAVHAESLAAEDRLAIEATVRAHVVYSASAQGKHLTFTFTKNEILKEVCRPRHVGAIDLYRDSPCARPYPNDPTR